MLNAYNTEVKKAKSPTLVKPGAFLPAPEMKFDIPHKIYGDMAGFQEGFTPSYSEINVEEMKHLVLVKLRQTFARLGGRGTSN